MNLVSWHLCTWVHFLTRREIRTNNYISLQFPEEMNTKGTRVFDLKSVIFPQLHEEYHVVTSKQY